MRDAAKDDPEHLSPAFASWKSPLQSIRMPAHAHTASFYLSDLQSIRYQSLASCTCTDDALHVPNTNSTVNCRAMEFVRCTVAAHESTLCFTRVSTLGTSRYAPFGHVPKRRSVLPKLSTCCLSFTLAIIFFGLWGEHRRSTRIPRFDRQHDCIAAVTPALLETPTQLQTCCHNVRQRVCSTMSKRYDLETIAYRSIKRSLSF